MTDPATALALAVAVATTARPPAFDLLTLGAHGGTWEGDLSCFAVRLAGRSQYKLLLDAGTVAEGVSAYLETREVPPVENFFFGVQEVLFTHSHLDHVAGFVAFSPTLFRRAGDPMKLRGRAETLETLRTHLFRSPLWVDFEAMGVVKLEEAAPERSFTVDDMKITPVAIDHTIPAQGYVLEAPTGDAMIHLGDTGPTRGEYAHARRYLAQGRLRALSLECSFPDEERELAILTGHLTPQLIARHLYELVLEKEPPARDLNDRELAEVGRRLGGTPVLLHHVKPEGALRIRAQVQDLRARGLPLVFLAQGVELSL